MNRVIFVSVALCLLLAPVLPLPTDSEKSAKLEDFSSGETSVVKTEETPAKQPEEATAQQPEGKHPEENEVNGPINRDVVKVPEKDSSSSESDEGTVATSSFNGQIAGVISRSNTETELQCRNCTCPVGTEKCTWSSKYSGEGEFLDVHYKCTRRNGSDEEILKEETKREPRPTIEESEFGFPGGFGGFSDVFKHMEEQMRNMREMFKNMFRGPFWGGEIDSDIDDE